MEVRLSMNTSSLDDKPQQINLCIHFESGARGDFLASVLLDSFTERNNGALKQPNYLKIHNDFYNNETRKLKKYICIRIDDNKSINNLMQIVFNQFLKNPVSIVNGYLDNFYTRVKECYYSCRELIDPNDYNYWIDFSYINNLEFLKTFYLHIHNREITNSIIYKIEQNIQGQLHWKSVPQLEALSWLIDFEIRCNLLNWNKTFSLEEYLSHCNPKSLLNFSNYSYTPFVL